MKKFDKDEGFPCPNYTEIPNVILDAIPDMSIWEIQVILYLARKTFGEFQGYKFKITDEFIREIASVTKLEHGAVWLGLAEAMNDNFILAIMDDKNWHWEVIYWNIDFSEEEIKEFIEKEKISPEKERAKLTSQLRWKIWARDNFTCQYCGAREFLEIDHIIPISKGGKTIAENLITACRNCNRSKHNKTFEEWNGDEDNG